MLEAFRDYSRSGMTIEHSQDVIVLPIHPSYYSDENYIYEVPSNKMNIHSFSENGFGGISLATIKMGGNEIVPSAQKFKIPENSPKNEKY